MCEPVRTFTRSDLDAARRAWDLGAFSAEWRDVRHKATLGGLIYPPAGSALDSWDDGILTQRAILIRAIRETPRLLEKCLIGAPSWHVVIARLTHARDEWRADNHESERDAEFHRDRPTHREAVTSLAHILERIEGAR